jgi:hypothetical protein
MIVQVVIRISGVMIHQEHKRAGQTEEKDVERKEKTSQLAASADRKLPWRIKRIAEAAAYVECVK